MALGLWSLLSFSLVARAEVTSNSDYRLDSNVLCDGLPQVNVKTLDGMCLGFVAGKQQGLKMPRYAVQARDGVIYLTEMGGWAYRSGTVYALTASRDSQGNLKTTLVNLFPNNPWIQPNGIVIDPEGRLYVGTPTAVYRFTPRDPATGKFNLDAPLETVIDDFGKSIFRKERFASKQAFDNYDPKLANKHPLVQLATNRDFTELYLNVGAPSDACTLGLKTIDDAGKCIQAESPLASAAVWKVSLSNDSNRKVVKVVPFARGLRNSMALVVHPTSGLVMQGDNGIDLDDTERPFEELNILKEGRHYGWPYCHSSGEVNEAFKGKVTPEVCLKQYALPAVFMPAHAAPLGLAYYQSPLLAPLAGQLLVSWHGREKYGHRVVAYPVDSNGAPTSNKYQEVVFGWESRPGIVPRGNPTGLTILNDGSILIMDDLNHAVLRLAKGEQAQPLADDVQVEGFSAKSVAAFQPLVKFVKRNCASCHGEFKKETALEIMTAMRGGMLDLSDPFDSRFREKLVNRKMPPVEVRAEKGFKNSDYDTVIPQVEAFLRTLTP
jgi:glucose/arabinose dehydrogenase